MLSKDFILAGRAVFTVSNPQGERYTYRINKAGTAAYPVWFIKLLTGPDNESSYTYLGMLNENLEVKLTEKSKFNEATLPVQVIRWIMKKVRTGIQLPPDYKMQHAGKCGRCGRTLTVPESIESGIGPECAKIMHRV